MFIPDYESAQPDLFKWMIEDMQERYPENKDAQYMIQAAEGDVPNKPGFGVNWDKPVYYLISERYCECVCARARVYVFISCVGYMMMQTLAQTHAHTHTYACAHTHTQARVWMTTATKSTTGASR